MEPSRNSRRSLTSSNAGDKSLLWAKRGIYLYFWLLIFEGALRKWILPQLSAPLLLVRDPVVLFIYWNAYRSRRVSAAEMTPFTIVGLSIALMAVIQFAIGTNDFFTAMFGVRSYLLHLPLIFVMKYALTMEDVKKIGRWLLIVSIPMTLLLIEQYGAPSNSWLNAGAGGKTNAQLYYAGNHVRASGTFSFITGTSDFFPFVEAFLIFGIAQIGTYPKWLLTSAILANIVAIPVAGSRTLLFSAAIVVSVGIFSLVSSGRSFVRLLKVGALISVAAAICLQLPVFQESLNSFSERWNNAEEAEGGEGAQGVLQVRVLDTLVEPFVMAADVPFFGLGIGLGSNVAAEVKTDGEVAGFLLSETEWTRIVQECGPIFGLLFLGYRVMLCGGLIAAPLRLRRRNSALGLLLAAAAVPELFLNVMEQPTHLGFMAFGAGLCMAASAKPRKAASTVLRIAPTQSAAALEMQAVNARS
jgi:hypothetical protein